MLHNIKRLYLHRVFHGIRFKVNNEDWLSVRMAFFVPFCHAYFLQFPSSIHSKSQPQKHLFNKTKYTDYQFITNKKKEAKPRPSE